MPLTAQQRIRLQELLLQREALYARVHALETEIHRIFGDEYPLPPPDVEVAQPGKPRAKTAKSATPKSTPPRLRNLDAHEAAYRVRYKPGAGAASELHTDRKAVEALLQSPMAVDMIQSVEAVDANGSVQEILFP